MSETVDDNKPSAMVRVPTPLIPAVRELSRLHRQGRTSEVLQCLDELILALDNSSNSTNNATSQTLSAIYERLDNLESQLLGEEPRNGTDSTQRLASLGIYLEKKYQPSNLDPRYPTNNSKHGWYFFLTVSPRTKNRGDDNSDGTICFGDYSNTK